MQVIKLDYAVTVSGGTGSTTTNTAGMTVDFSYNLANLGIKAPTEAATYNIKIYDPDNYLTLYETDITGSMSIACNRICRDGIKVQIDGTNGAYTVRLYLEKK